ncbi:FkbM family methyltransferase [Mycolicibacter sinensis]|jgi:FkbM family methyltransferase|uniref:Methyltransferase FkbM n=1 Tax=Mycolicibacter sinensis (strain JDM601) TaxID=875328 RepID=A0A1A2E8L2_MYCSD|nr:FkbM family methyltransferase [Mycolicibacter sinensis]OBG01457.1 methyltransferase FkbM [Mycolicibacter sinensis]OBG10865.1 methyltransferase FkbM [Mycolicibacter sinensis]
MRRSAKLLAILRVAPYRTALLRHRVAAAVEHREGLAGLTLRTVVDVGANRGQFALFARHAFPAARIVSLEPLAAPAARFQRVFADEPRVTLHHAALGPASGESTMHVSGHDDSSSLLPITATQRQLFHGTGEVGTETVRIGPLSEFLDGGSIDGPALLKLDVQGYELEALRGCGELLDRFDYVCAEGSFIELYKGQVLADELTGWLREHGFELVRSYGAVSDENGRAIQTDMLFKRGTPG